jgi:hypothetical protein
MYGISTFGSFFWIKDVKAKYSSTFGAKYGYHNVWANYNDLTVLPNPGIMLNKGIIPK